MLLLTDYFLFLSSRTLGNSGVLFFCNLFNLFTFNYLKLYNYEHKENRFSHV